VEKVAMRSAFIVGERGYAMAALLVAIGVMGIVLSVAMPAWRTATQREKEAELIFRGQQYAHAVALFQRKYAGAFPPNVDMLVDQKFLRKKYKDPITGEDFQIVPVGAAGTPTPGAGTPTPGAPTPQGARGQLETLGRQTGGFPGAAAQQPGGRAGGPTTTGMIGVVSKSTETSLRLFNGRNHYNEWVFVATQATTAAGAPGGVGAPTPGGVGGGLPGRGGPQDGRGQRGVGGQRGTQGQPSAPPFGGQPGAPPFGGRPGMPPPGGQQQSPFQPPGRGRL
jgi:type II secretory pathway pseudopilin PulG